MKTSIRAAMIAATTFTTLSSPVSAFPYGSNFTHEPTGYRVNVRETGARSMVLTGTQPETGKTFKLNVSSDGHVTGMFNDTPVDYFIDKDGNKRVVVASR